MASQVCVFIACSVDGFIAGPDDDLSWLPSPDPQGVDAGSDAGYGDFMARVGALLMGRRTYDVVRALGVPWPYGDRPVLVATHRPLDEGAPQGVRQVCGELPALVAQAAQAAGGRDVYLDGGQLIRAALDAGLVDQMTISIVPVVLGQGVPLWVGLSRRRALQLLGSQTLPQGMVQLRYALS